MEVENNRRSLAILRFGLMLVFSLMAILGGYSANDLITKPQFYVIIP